MVLSKLRPCIFIVVSFCLLKFFNSSPSFIQFSPNGDLAPKGYHNLVLTYFSLFIYSHFLKGTLNFIQSCWACGGPTNTGLGSPFMSAGWHWFSVQKQFLPLLLHLQILLFPNPAHSPSQEAYFAPSTQAFVIFP